MLGRVRFAAPLVRRFVGAAQAAAVPSRAAVTPGALAAVAGFGAAATFALHQGAAGAACEGLFGGADWKGAIRKDIVAILEDEKLMDEPPGPIFIRLAWHSAGTFCKQSQTGGSNGATMRFHDEASWGANAGLHKARALLQGVKEKHNVSYSDLWVFAACVAVEEMGGPKIAFTPGRKDKPPSATPGWTCDTAKDGRLPGADAGSDQNTAAHLRYIFNRMGFDDQEIVALSGAHGLGRCHETSSGYWGPWTRAPTTISNEYFRLLFEEKWTVKKTHLGKQWTGPLQYEDPSGELMMLPSDMVLVKDPSFKKYAQMYYKDEAKFMDDFGKVFTKLMNLGFKN